MEDEKRKRESQPVKGWLDLALHFICCGADAGVGRRNENELPLEPPEPRAERFERDEDEVYQEYKDARLERELEAEE